MSGGAPRIARRGTPARQAVIVRYMPGHNLALRSAHSANDHQEDIHHVAGAFGVRDAVDHDIDRVRGGPLPVFLRLCSGILRTGLRRRAPGCRGLGLGTRPLVAGAPELWSVARANDVAAQILRAARPEIRPHCK